MDAQAALAAFDRQNHAGASDALAASLRQGAQHSQPDPACSIFVMHMPWRMPHGLHAELCVNERRYDVRKLKVGTIVVQP